MKAAYFECFAGAAGDMILGSLLDAGLDLEKLKEEIAKLGLSHYDIQAERVMKCDIAGTKARITYDESHHGHHHRNLHHITEIVETSSLDNRIKDKSLAVFRRLAEAEARAHNTTVDKIHFHEVGAVDAIIDVVGSVAGLNALGIDVVCCSRLRVGSGSAQCAHGAIPIPAPATCELIKGKPVYSDGVKGELLTPTGAAILTTLATSFGLMPPMTPDKVGYGAGTADLPIPNMLRVVIGELQTNVSALECEMRKTG
jgi:uncharacterized protein (TIGR00299 family) protein